ncbi:MAG: hypothetical protein RLZZ628_1355 [Bacteroidota bacterium]|jgi:hypothetical protein
MNHLMKNSFKALTIWSLFSLVACQKESATTPISQELDNETASNTLETRAAATISIAAELINEDNGDDNTGNSGNTLEFFGKAALQVKSGAKVVQAPVAFMDQPEKDPFYLRQGEVRNLKTLTYNVPAITGSKLTLNLDGHLYESNTNKDDGTKKKASDNMGAQHNVVKVSALTSTPLIIEQIYKYKKEKGRIKYTITVK